MCYLHSEKLWKIFVHVGVKWRCKTWSALDQVMAWCRHLTHDLSSTRLVTFIWGEFHKRYPSHHSLNLLEKYLFKVLFQISRGQRIKICQPVPCACVLWSQLMHEGNINNQSWWCQSGTLSNLWESQSQCGRNCRALIVLTPYVVWAMVVESLDSSLQPIVIQDIEITICR